MHLRFVSHNSSEDCRWTTYRPYTNIGKKTTRQPIHKYIQHIHATLQRMKPMRTLAGGKLMVLNQVFAERISRNMGYHDFAVNNDRGRELAARRHHGRPVRAHAGGVQPEDVRRA